MVIGDLLMFSAPVALAALGETVAQKSGLINIGLEGDMLAGAFFGMLGSYATGSPWIGLALGISVGVILALVSGWFCIHLSADQVVVGTAVNLFSIGLTGTLFRMKFGSSGQLLSVAKLPRFAALADTDPIILFMAFAAVLLWFVLNKTAWGLAVRAAGEAPKAAEAAGFSVQKLRFQALGVGGFFGGMAGAYLSLGVAGSFAENMTAGRGFVAIAMVTFGRWRPVYVFFAALLIGYADSLQFLLQGGASKVPPHLLLAMPYVLALVVLIIVGKGTQAPEALAKPYRREK
jgi:general nucleoside transport system permease protein